MGLIRFIRGLFSKAKQYRCFVFLCDANSPAVWRSEAWARLAELLSTVIEEADGRPHISVDEYRATPEGLMDFDQEIKLGATWLE